MIDDADLAYMRAEALDVAMPDVCAIQRLQRSPDGRGGFTESWVNAWQNVVCRIMTSDQANRERVVADRPTMTVDYVLSLPWDQAIDETMRVYIDSTAYEVVFAKIGSFRTATRAGLRRVDAS